ncbi:MAG TPA: hypothetical protein VMB50_02940 [Myxococcales bacterium]|nr:hypothetical protein [Myxococcales bacterium]
MTRYKLSANVSSARPKAVEPALEELIGNKGTIHPTDDGFQVEATLEGTSAKDLNRQLLSALRRLEKKTRLRSEWNSGDVTERFFDYVPKGTKKAGP